MARNDTARSFVIVLMMLSVVACDQGADPSANTVQGMIGSDADVWSFITSADPYGSYTLFPFADSVVAGTLNGSNAHRPTVRVSLNARAVASLNAGRFPAGGSFRDSSVVFKLILTSGSPTLIAVMVKHRGNPLAAGDWLWAEYGLDGSVVYPISNKGAGCTGCHGLEQGLQHDLVRTFERQSP